MELNRKDQTMNLKGQWTFTGYDEKNPSIGTWHCSNCGYIVLGKKERQYNFCPYCGTDMREKEGDNETKRTL